MRSFCPCSEEEIICSDSLQGQKFLTQNELNTCGTLPNPQTFPYGPLAAGSAALPLLPLLASLVYGNDEGQSYEEENEGLARL